MTSAGDLERALTKERQVSAGLQRKVEELNGDLASKEKKLEDLKWQLNQQRSDYQSHEAEAVEERVSSI